MIPFIEKIRKHPARIIKTKTRLFAASYWYIVDLMQATSIYSMNTGDGWAVVAKFKKHDAPESGYSIDSKQTHRENYLYHFDEIEKARAV